MLRSIFSPAKGEVFIETLLSMGCKVGGRLCPNSMKKEVVKKKLNLPRITEELVPPLTDPLSILT